MNAAPLHGRVDNASKSVQFSARANPPAMRLGNKSKRGRRAWHGAGARFMEALENRLLFSVYTVTNLNDSGIGSLRYEIAQANAHAGADTVTFAAGLTGKITLTSGQLEISDTSGATTIAGPGVSAMRVTAAGRSRMFQIDGGATATISGLNITNGTAVAVPGGPYGNGGAILSLGTINLVSDDIGSSTALLGAGLCLDNALSVVSTVTNCLFSGNNCNGGAGGGIDVLAGSLNIVGTSFLSDIASTGNVGGAIALGANRSAVTVTRCIFSGNEAFNLVSSETAGGGAIDNAADGTLTVSQSSFAHGYTDNEGAAIYNAGTMNLSGDAFVSNHAVEGGGAIVSTGPATIAGSTFSNNLTEGGSGGAILSSGKLTLSTSAFSNSTCGNFGGAVETDGPSSIVGCTFADNLVPASIGAGGGAINNRSTLSVINSTFVANNSNLGGAIANEGTLVLDDSTVTGNIATPNGNPTTGGGVYSAAGASTQINNTIVAGNLCVAKAAVGSQPAVYAPGDIQGTVAGDANLIGVGGSGGLVNGVNGNIVGVANPLLAPLASNGGPTQTVALLAGSPAAGAGKVSLIPPGVATDQRGLPRTVNGSLDIGAYENQVGTLTGAVFNDANGNGLRDPGEAGVAGVRVFLDYAGTGIWNAKTEPSVLTNSAGVFTFTNIPAVQYNIAEVVPPGANQTTPTGDLVATVIAGKTVNAGLFGEIQIAANTGTIAGVIFNDHNVNGVQDPGDAGLANVKVFLDLNHSGAYAAGDPYTYTGASGAYTFAGVKPGTYAVGEVVPAGYRQGFPFGGVENSATVVAGQIAQGVNFGDTTTSRVSGFVYVDLNSHGAGPGKTGIANVTLVVKPTSGNGPSYTVVTNSAGYYVAGTLPNGVAYSVTLAPPAGYTLDSGSLTQTTTVLGSGQTADNVDFLGHLATPVVFDSQNRFVAGDYGIDSDYYTGNVTGAPGQLNANGFAPFNGSVSGSFDTGPIHPAIDPGIFDITVSASASQKSTLSPSEISASGSIAATENDGAGGAGATFASAESYVQTTFTVYAPTTYSLAAMLNPEVVMTGTSNSAKATLTIAGPGGAQVIPPQNWDSSIGSPDNVAQSGTLAVGTYTVTLDVTAYDRNDFFPTASYNVDLKLG